MWLARATTDGHCLVCQVDPYEVSRVGESYGAAWYRVRRKPRRWAFHSWSGMGWAAIGFTREQAIESAYAGFARMAA